MGTMLDKYLYLSRLNKELIRGLKLREEVKWMREQKSEIISAKNT